MSHSFTIEKYGKRAKRIAIVGAGPIGLEAAIRCVREGFPFDVYESGRIGEHIQRWGHVTLFTPFSMNRSRCGMEAVTAENPGHDFPADHALLTGREYVERYLLPLSRSSGLQDHIHTGHRVVSIGRHGLLKHEAIVGDARKNRPFRLLIETDGGDEKFVDADIVIDASGVYSQPNHLGCCGIPAIGERSCAEFIHYGLDDIAGEHRLLYEGKRTLLIGAGYSAATAMVALKDWVSSNQETQIIWLTRSSSPQPIRVIDHDRLPARLALAVAANRIAGASNHGLKHCPGMGIERLEPAGNGALIVHAVHTNGEHRRFEVDRVLANVGYHPDRSIYNQLQIHECYATLAPIKLAASLMAESVEDCLDRKASPVDTLINPEPDFYILGAKSYGRDSTFLLQSGIAQVDQVFTLLTSNDLK